MTLVATQGLWLPGMDFSPFLTGAYAAQTIDADNEKLAFIGQVWNKDRATKSIRTIGFPFGTVTKAGGSALTVSLQDVSLTAGPTYQPDGTPDQTVAIANADAAFVSNTWYQTGNLSADRSVAFGEYVAIVIEFDGATHMGADTVGVRALNVGAITANRGLNCGVSLYTGSWAVITNAPAVVLGFSDGTFGNLTYGIPVSAFGTISYDTGTATDENGLKFQVPFECKCDGAFFYLQTAAVSCDASIVLYEGTTQKAISAIDYNAHAQLSTNGPAFVTWDEVTLAANTDYYLVVKPTTTNNVQIPYMDVADANHFQAWPGGTTWHYAARADAGAWSATTTRRPFAGIRISAVHDGSGGGAGIAVLTGGGRVR